MDLITNYITSVINVVINLIKLVVEKLSPVVASLYKLLAPILIAIFAYIISIDYYKIVTSKPFIILVLFIVSLYLTYAILTIYNPDLLKKIIDFFRLKRPKRKFKFESSVDISIESK